MTASAAAPAEPHTTPTLTDEQLLALADQNAVTVEGQALHEFDDVLRAANGGLIDVATPKEFEQRLRTEIKLGSKDFENAWTDAERFDHATATPDEQSRMNEAKWAQFVNDKYLDYLRDKAGQRREATYRMNNAANGGKAIAGGTLVGVVGLGAVAAAPLAGAATTALGDASLSLGAGAAIWSAAHPLAGTALTI
jgi:hypothetical protein